MADVDSLSEGLPGSFRCGRFTRRACLELLAFDNELNPNTDFRPLEFLAVNGIPLLAPATYNCLVDRSFCVKGQQVLEFSSHSTELHSCSPMPLGALAILQKCLLAAQCDRRHTKAVSKKVTVAWVADPG